MSKPKTRRMTAKRRLFLRLVDSLRKHFDDCGALNDEITSDEVAGELLKIVEAADDGVGPSIASGVLCSAIHAMLQTPLESDIDRFHETSLGGEVVEIAYIVGWSQGYGAASNDIALDSEAGKTMYQTDQHDEHGFKIMLDGHPVATVTRLGRRVEGDDAAGWAVERAMPMEMHTTDEQWQELVSIFEPAPAGETRGATK